LEAEWWKFGHRKIGTTTKGEKKTKKNPKKKGHLTQVLLLLESTSTTLDLTMANWRIPLKYIKIIVHKVCKWQQPSLLSSFIGLAYLPRQGRILCLHSL
jgi:hypothetical protein